MQILAAASFVLFNIPYTILYFRPIPFFDQCVYTPALAPPLISPLAAVSPAPHQPPLPTPKKQPQKTNRYLIQPKRARSEERSTAAWWQAAGHQAVAVLITYLLTVFGSVHTIRLFRCGLFVLLG